MPQKLTCLQAYQIMLQCFNNLYFQTYDDDLAFLVSNAALHSIDQNGKQEPQTMDPAVWHDWMKGIKIILNDPSAHWNTTKLTIEQAYQAAGQYFSIHCNIGLLKNIGTLRDLLKNNAHNIELEQWLRHKWEKAYVTIAKSSNTNPMEHFFGASTSLSLRESFMIMQIYLNNICMKNRNDDLLTLLQNSRILNHHSNYWQEEPIIIDQTIWQLWIDAITLVKKADQNEKLNVMLAYKAMPKFLSLYFHNNKTSYIESLINKFDTINEQSNSISNDNWMAFNLAVVRLNAQQTEIVFHLISINTPITLDVAKKIIIAWFSINQLNFDWIKYLDQACKTVKQHQRSYLLLDNEITILEAYHVMIEIIKRMNQTNPNENFALFLQNNAVGQDGKPMDFIQLLTWIKSAEQIS